jgi:hypothetical protein
MLLLLRLLWTLMTNLFKSRRRLEAGTSFFGISSILLYDGHPAVGGCMEVTGR